MTHSQAFLEKYQHIIAEEVNVKEVSLLSDSLQVTKTYIPLGKALAEDFGKDTGQIIAAAKQGKVKALEEGKIKVSNNDQERVLDASQYDIRYSGLEGDNQIVEEGAIIELDLTLTDALKAEGVAREFSRSLNEIRKQENFYVNDRVQCWYKTDTPYIKKVLEDFGTYLKEEALLSQLVEYPPYGSPRPETGQNRTITIQEIEGGKVDFYMKK